MKKKTMKKMGSAVKGMASSIKDTMDDDAPHAKDSKRKDDSCVCASAADCCAGWGLLILRLVVGIVFIYHGVWKFQNWSMASGMFGGLFGGAGTFLLGLVAVVEIVAGIALVIGLWTRWAGYLLAIIMAVAIIWAKKFGWPAIELDLILLAASLALAWNGPGKWSAHSKCGCCGDSCNC